jgi:hypothetical protein
MHEVTRVEVITDKGRKVVVYIKKGSLFLMPQDEGRTLKIFATEE